MLPGSATANSNAGSSTTAAPAPVLNNRITVFEDKRYTYDRHGCVTQRLSGSANNQTQLTLAWDDEHQLVSAKTTKTRDGSQTQQTTHYHYDAFGRRISKAGEFGQTSFLWDGNRLLQERRGGDSGRATASTKTQQVTTTVYEPESFVPLAQLAWTENAENQAQTDQAPVYAQRTGTYDATHDEILGGLDQALAGVDGYKANDSAHIEYQNNSGKQPPTPTTAYLTSANTSAKNHPPATINYYHCDQIGAPRELTDEHGAVTWSATYKAWGRVEKEQSDKGLSLAAQDGEITSEYANAHPAEPQQTHQPLRFQGQYYDAETGLHYNRFRYYEPDAGRYISSDPIGLLGGANSSEYAPNALTWSDPYGLAKKKTTGKKCDDCGPCPPSGYIDPSKVRFLQDSIKGTFKDGKSVEQTAAGLRGGTILPSSIPAIRIFEKAGLIWSLDHRRLHSFKEAGIPVPCKNATPVEIAAEFLRKNSTENGGESIIIRGK